MFIFRFYQVGAPSLRASYYGLFYKNMKTEKLNTLFSFFPHTIIYFTENQKVTIIIQYIFTSSYSNTECMMMVALLALLNLHDDSYV
jgi:hypothetical protein